MIKISDHKPQDPDNIRSQIMGLAVVPVIIASDETAIVLVSGSHKKNCEEGEGVVP